jgi:predicted Zn-dependent protease
MTIPEKTTSTTPEVTLEKAIAMARSGDKASACQMLRQLVAQQPLNQAAWIWLSAVTTDRDEAVSALDRAREINPAHETLPRAEQWLIHRFSVDNQTQKSPAIRESAPGPEPQPAPPSRS